VTAKHLDSDGSYCRNDVQRSSEYAIAWLVWVIFPDGCLVLDRGYLRYVPHHSNIGEVYHMFEASVAIVT
jgi:hypothetical protein